MIDPSFWTFLSMNQWVIAIPYTASGIFTGPYIWSNQGQNNMFVVPLGAPGCRVGGIVGQFLMTGDVYEQQNQLLFTGNGVQTTFTGTLPTPLASTGSIYDQAGTLAGSFENGVIVGSGRLASGSINYATGAIQLSFSAAPAPGDNVYARFIQQSIHRVAWSAIGDPTLWPTPLTNAAIAVQSGINELEEHLGPIMYIAGYPLYGLIFQRFGITRASYIGGDVVFSWATYERAKGLVAHGAAVQVGQYVFFLADDGFYVTDGANVLPFGTAQDNSAGIDNWFWANVNQNALEAIRAAYDAVKRCVMFAIPTGTNTLPDTLLTFNILAQKWTKAAVPCQTIWTTDNGEDNSPGTRQTLGLIDQTSRPAFLNGPTMTGYLESCDVYFVDGMRRLCTAVRPHVNSTDLPLITVGARDSLQDPVTYGVPSNPDPFAREAPALSSGMYMRVRTQSQQATSIHGDTLMLETEGPV